MKLIMEVDEEDITKTFKESYLDGQIKIDDLEYYHFNVTVTQMWNTVHEVYFQTRIKDFKVKIK